MTAWDSPNFLTESNDDFFGRNFRPMKSLERGRPRSTSERPPKILRGMPSRDKSTTVWRLSGIQGHSEKLYGMCMMCLRVRGDFEEQTYICANLLDNFLKCYLRFGFNMVSYTVVPFAKAFGLSIGCKNSGRVSSFLPRYRTQFFRIKPKRFSFKLVVITIPSYYKRWHGSFLYWT